jgi:1-acyl-sn-glycerol-3-phosphate acyltransferase
VRLIRIAGKGVLLAAHMAVGGALAALRPRALDERFAHWWCKVACAILGLRVRRLGARPLGPALYAANHVSWLEVVALESLTPLGFVAKAEVSRWPVIGGLAAAAGTLFLRRGSSPEAARAARAATLRLAEGRSVAFFPEGTSTEGSTVLPFRAALFESAARLGCDVQPVSVFYPRAAGKAPVAPFIGDDEFLPHLLRVLGESEIVVDLVFAAPLSGHGRTREELAAASREAVVAGLHARRGARAGLGGSPETAPESFTGSLVAANAAG